MKFVLLIFVFLSGHVAAISQTADKARQIDQVQAAVGSLASKKAEFLLSDFNFVEGTVTTLMLDSFSLKIKRMDGEKAVIKVLYKDVLAVSGKDVSLNLIPDPALQPYGTWDDVLKIEYNRNLEIVLQNGETVSGRLYEKSKDRLTLVGETIDQKFPVARDQVSFIFRVRDGFNKAADGTAGGARKGRSIGDAIGNTSDGKAFSAALGSGIGALIGAVMGAGKVEPELRVLIYSK